MTDTQNMPNFSVKIDQVRAYIRSLMAEKGVTVAKLADITGIAKGTLDNFFDGTTKAPTFDKVCTIIVSLGGSVDEALGLKLPMKPAAVPADLAHLMASHKETIKAKDDFIADLRAALAAERKKIKSLMLYQRLLIIENVLIVFVFILDYYNHDWGYFRGSALMELFFPKDDGRTVIFRG